MRFLNIPQTLFFFSQPTYQSPMATGSPFDSTNCPQSLTVSSSPIVHQTSQPVKASTATTGHILTPKTSQPHFQELSEIHSQCATTQPHSQPQVSMQPRSHSKPDEGFKSTPSSMQLRLMLAASGHQSGHRTPPPGQPPSVRSISSPLSSVSAQLSICIVNIYAHFYLDKNSEKLMEHFFICNVSWKTRAY